MLKKMLFIPLLLCLFAFATPCSADLRNDPCEQALSDALDLWREGRFELLYDNLSHRGGMGREQFVQFMREAQRKPACCHLKLNDFRLIAVRTTTAKVFARVGMEEPTGTETNQSREFTLYNEEGRWKPGLSGFKSLAGGKKKKKG